MYDDHRPLITDAPTSTASGHPSLDDRIQKLTPGQHVTSTVTKMLPFGTFVEFDQLRKLTHTSDLEPKDQLTPGQQIEVEITAADTRLTRIGLRPARH